MERLIRAGQIVRHFKGALYEILYEAALHSETKERLVVYKALATGQVYVRPYEMFMSEVDREKYPNVTQHYRFEVTDVNV